MTTIKVPVALRERISGAARSNQVTIAAFLESAVAREERESFFAQTTAQMERLRRDDPAEWEGYRAEMHEWEAGTIADSLHQE